MNSEAVDLLAVWDAVQGQWLSMAQDRGVEMQFRRPESFLPSVKADAQRVTLVMNCLMDNAVSYTLSGGVVQIYVVQDTGTVRFVIKDTGIGVRSNETRRLFTPGFRGSNAYLQKRDGLGLALHKSKCDIEQMRGKMGYETTEGKGSTFWFALPLAK